MIKFYSTGCPKCKVLKMKMALKNIPFEEITDLKEMMAHNFKSAPVLDIDGKILNFNEAIQWVKEQGVHA